MWGLQRRCWRIAVRYFDTSALVKQYLQEAGSKTVLELLKTGEKVYMRASRMPKRMQPLAGEPAKAG